MGISPTGIKKAAKFGGPRKREGGKDRGKKGPKRPPGGPPGGSRKRKRGRPYKQQRGVEFFPPIGGGEPAERSISCGAQKMRTPWCVKTQRVTLWWKTTRAVVEKNNKALLIWRRITIIYKEKRLQPSPSLLSPTLVSLFFVL